ncbi:MAG: hypothetical protein ACI81Y_001909 [Glaciecola sp.]
MKPIVLLSILTVFYHSLSGQDNAAYSFLVAGHTYGAAGVDNIGLHPPFKDKFEYIQGRPEIQFGIFTGDIVSSNPTAEDWDEVDVDIAALGLPIYFAVGNHDMEDRPLFEDRYGDTYFHFLHEGDLFIILDPNIDGWNISGEQLVFLENTLLSNQDVVSNIYVFFHQVLWKTDDNIYSNITPNSITGQSETVNFWPTIMPLFTSLSNHTMFFAGDLGAASWSTDFSYDSFDNIELIGSGMGEFNGENFVVINVGEDKSIDHDLICLNGDELECFGELTDYQVTPLGLVRSTQNLILIYPNPTKDKLYINGLKENMSMALYDTLGRVVSQKEISPGSNSIDLQNFQSGLYNLILIDSAGNIHSRQKIVKS